jgi:hypothetical protein
MKKLALVVLMLFFVTGCTIVRIDTSKIDNIINVILSKKNDLYNRAGKGYKYYIPRGVTYIDTSELNDKLYSNGYYYYLYTDVISYYNKIGFEYVENEKAFYAKKINMQDKEGYLEINKHGDKYLLEFMYNYAKIEVLVYEDDINEAVLNASYILSTIKFNKNVIKIMLNDAYFSSKEEQYDIFKPSNDIQTNQINY